MIKIVELLKRQPGLSVADFQARWLAHGPVRAAVPGILRHVQSHALPQGYRKGELLFDGIAEYWVADQSAWQVVRAAAAWRDAESDAEAFADPARRVTMAVDVHVIKDGAIPADAVKNIEFVNRRSGMELESFRRYWRTVHGPLAATIPVLRRYEQNHLTPESYARTPNPPYDGLAITWFASTADMKAGTLTPEYAATRADEPNFLPDGHLPIIIAHEHAFQQADAGAPAQETDTTLKV